MSDKKIYVIVAMDKNRGIGKDGKLPWHLKKEMQYFKDTTSETMDFDKKNMVVMGRKTWESIDEKYRPLEGRLNCVITRNKHYEAEGADVCYSLGEALRKAEQSDEVDNVFIIGGAQMFELALPIANGAYITQINKEFDCDTFLEELPTNYIKKPENLGSEEENATAYEFLYFNAIKEEF